MTVWVVKLTDGSVLEIASETCRHQAGFIAFAKTSKAPEDMAIRADLVEAYGRKESLAGVVEVAVEEVDRWGGFGD